MEALRERFGKYHVLHKIAQGGMAEVYKVKTIGIAGFEKVQALKRILPQSARERRFIRSFVDEARIAVELTHRNIVQVFDFGKADGELFLAMELIEGKDLRSAMSQSVARERMVPLPVAAYIVAEIAAGLDYAHRKTDGYGGSLGIVHCDVSPSNVMLSSDGFVKILDFGIARATFAAALERRRLRGKPRYMAPEQTLGEPPTAAADVFALGIIAWELFTGEPLYRGPNLRAILEAVRTTEPPRLDRIRPQVPAEIVEAVATALAHDRARRGTAADLGAACTRTALLGGARALAGWLADLDAPATRPSATTSLADMVFLPGELGAGTPGLPEGGTLFPSEPADEPAAEPPSELPAERTTVRNLDGWVAGAGIGAAPGEGALPDPSFQDREATVPNEQYARPSYRSLQLERNASQGPMWFDDAVTHHWALSPTDGAEDTRFDPLALEPDDPAGFDE